MGKPALGHREKVYFGRSEGDSSDPATLDEALRSVAEQIVEHRVVTPDNPVWFEITSLKVEIANQHVKTYVVGATQQGAGESPDS
jgi:hypothetical protein